MADRRVQREARKLVLWADVPEEQRLYWLPRDAGRFRPPGGCAAATFAGWIGDEARSHAWRQCSAKPKPGSDLCGWHDGSRPRKRLLRLRRAWRALHG